MSYVRVESSVPRNRKFLQAGPAASWLWLCGLAYCQEGLTDGFIPAEAIDILGCKNAQRLSNDLARVGLWDPTVGGWYVHDYLEHNKSAADVAKIKQERREAGKLGGAASVEAKLKQLALEVAQANGNHGATTAFNPSTSTSTATSPATATEAPTATTRAAPLARRRNLNAAYEGPRGLYVLHGQHQKFIDLHNGAVSELDLFAWYESVAEDWATGEHKSTNTGPDMPKFWDARFEERWPAPPKPDARTPAWMRTRV